MMSCDKKMKMNDRDNWSAKVSGIYINRDSEAEGMRRASERVNVKEQRKHDRCVHFLRKKDTWKQGVKGGKGGEKKLTALSASCASKSLST